jgi:hypothetical protein
MISTLSTNNGMVSKVDLKAYSYYLKAPQLHRNVRIQMISTCSRCDLPMQTSPWAEAESRGAPHSSGQ